jgi:hypothetical protein
MMCRNIRPLFNIDPPAAPEEITDAALQFVRKVSGYQKPSRLNQPAFDKAVSQVAAAVQTLLEDLETSAPKRPAPRRNTTSGIH